VPFAPQGVEGVSRWRRLIPADTPLVAIGGLTLDNAPAVLEAGADGVSVIGAVAKDFGAIRTWNALFPA